MDGIQLNEDRRQLPPTERDGEEPLSDAAFDQWLTHHLRRLYDPVTNEPIPADLIRALENRLK